MMIKKIVQRALLNPVLVIGMAFYFYFGENENQEGGTFNELREIE